MHHLHAGGGGFAFVLVLAAVVALIVAFWPKAPSAPEK